MALVEALRRRDVAGPLLLLNLGLYALMLGFSSWALDSFIDGWQYHPGLRGNAATLHFVQLAALAAALGVSAGAAAYYHHRYAYARARGARGGGLAAATALAFGLACKEARAGGAGGVQRGWRLRALEGLAGTLAFTQLLYVLLLHTAVAGDDHQQCEPGRCPDDGAGEGEGEGEGEH